MPTIYVQTTDQRAALEKVAQAAGGLPLGRVLKDLADHYGEDYVARRKAAKVAEELAMRGGAA